MSRRKPSVPRKLDCGGGDGLGATVKNLESHISISEVSTEVTPVNQETCDPSRQRVVCTAQEPASDNQGADPKMLASSDVAVQKETIISSIEGVEVTTVQNQGCNLDPKGRQVKKETCEHMIQSSEVTVKQEPCDPILQTPDISAIKKEACEAIPERSNVSGPNRPGSNVAVTKQEPCDQSLQGSQVTLGRSKVSSPNQPGSKVDVTKQELCDPNLQGSQVTPVGSQVTPMGSQVTPVSSKVTPVSSKVTPVSSQVTHVSLQVNPVSSQVTPVSSKVNPVSSQVTPVKQESPALQEYPMSSDEDSGATTKVSANKSSDHCPEFVWHAENNTVTLTGKNTSNKLSTSHGCTVQELSVGSFHVMEIFPLEENSASSEDKQSENSDVVRCERVHKSLSSDEKDTDGCCTFKGKEDQDSHLTTHKVQQFWRKVSVTPEEEAKSHLRMHSYKHQGISKPKNQQERTKTVDDPLVVGPCQPAGLAESLSVTTVNSSTTEAKSMGKEYFFKCDICQARFFTENDLNCHVPIHEREMKKLKASSADQLADTRKEALSLYAKKYPFRCELCRERFGTKRRLDSHKAVKHYQQYSTGNTEKVPAVGITPPGYSLVRYNKQVRTKSVDGSFIVGPSQSTGTTESLSVTTVKTTAGTKTVDKPLVVGPSQSTELSESLSPRITTVKDGMTTVKTTAEAKSTGKEYYLQCDICQARFFTKHHLSRHIEVHMREIKKLKANSADQLADTRKEALSVYAKMHPFQCDMCGERFQTERGLEFHKVYKHYQQNTTGTTEKVPTVGIIPPGFSIIQHNRRNRYTQITDCGKRSSGSTEEMTVRPIKIVKVEPK